MQLRTRTYFKIVTSWTLPTKNIFFHVSIFPRWLNLLIVYQTKNIKLGTNVKKIIQNPHQNFSFSICSFPTIKSPENIKDNFNLRLFSCFNTTSSLLYNLIYFKAHLLIRSYKYITNENIDLTKLSIESAFASPITKPKESVSQVQQDLFSFDADASSSILN